MKSEVRWRPFKPGPIRKSGSKGSQRLPSAPLRWLSLRFGVSGGVATGCNGLPDLLSRRLLGPDDGLDACAVSALTRVVLCDTTAEAVCARVLDRAVAFGQDRSCGRTGAGGAAKPTAQTAAGQTAALEAAAIRWRPETAKAVGAIQQPSWLLRLGGEGEASPGPAPRHELEVQPPHG